MKFDQLALDPRILAGVHTAGYSAPTPIQGQAIPVVLDGRDVLGLAQTGTGKTAAFILPILNRLTTGPLGQIRALVIAPTCELAEQINQTAIDLGRNTRVRSIAIYGGVSKGRQIAELRRGAEIVVACPGRLLDHLGDGGIDLSHVEVLVLDEADRMCDMGFLPDIRRILKVVPARRQTLFFAATMPPEIRTLADSILKNPATVQIGVMAPVETVSHALYPVPDGNKKKLLLGMLQQVATGRVLDLHAHEAARSQPGARPGKRGVSRSRLCRGTWRRRGARRRSTASAAASTTSWLPPTSPRAASMSRRSPTSSISTCRTRSMPIPTASGARAAPSIPARRLRLWRRRTNRWYARSNACWVSESSGGGWPALNTAARCRKHHLSRAVRPSPVPVRNSLKPGVEAVRMAMSAPRDLVGRRQRETSGRAGVSADSRRSAGRERMILPRRG